MAFLNRARSLLKATVGNKISISDASVLQSVRWMSSSKLFVGGLSYNTDDLGLREAFGQYGEVVEARIISDRDTGRSRGFGFVTYTSTDSASSAIQALDGQDLHGRRIRVNYATERSQRGGFGGGGFGGSNYGGFGSEFGGSGFGNDDSDNITARGGSGGGGFKFSLNEKSGKGSKRKVEESEEEIGDDYEDDDDDGNSSDEENRAGKK